MASTSVGTTGTATATPQHALLGAYVGAVGPANEQAFNTLGQEIGHQPDFALTFLNQNSWSEFDNSVSWALSQWTNHEKLVISVPLIPSGADLATAATGAYNQHYLAAAEKIAAYDPNTVIRIGWEMNGTWEPWSAASNPDAYIAAYRQAVDTFRSVSTGFKFDWTPNLGTQAINPEKVYPGDQYVDTIGLDVYENTAWLSGMTPQQRWDYIVNQPNGLQWQKDFAAAHGKQLSYPEYSSNFNDGFFVTQMANWIKSNNVAFHSWWDLNVAFDGALQDHPANLAAYEAAWSGSTTGGTPGGTTGGSISGGTFGTGSDKLVLTLSEDAWQGDAQFTVAIDGKQIGGAHSVTASHAAGATEVFTFLTDQAAGAHQVAITFINDAYGGSTSADRNLYVNAASYDGTQIGSAAKPLFSNGADSFGVSDTTAIPGATPAPAPAPTPAPVPTPSPTPGVGGTFGTGSDKLVLSLSEDAWQGDAQFTVTIDGKQIGGVETVTAAHALGAAETFTFLADEAVGAHQVAVSFINDAYGGSTAADRNLYVTGASYDGVAVSGAAKPLFSNGADAFAVGDATAIPGATPAPTPAPAPAPVPAPTPTVSGAAVATPTESRNYVAPDATGTAHGTSGADDIYASGAGQTLIGGGGDDIFHIGTNTDAKIVVGNSGITAVSTYSASYTLAAGVDNLSLAGAYAHTAHGNGLNNWITASDGNDTIFGGGGNVTIAVGLGADTLTGQGQHDMFVFGKAADHDAVITDYHQGQDVLDLRGLFKDGGYSGTDPIADHVLQIAQSGADTVIGVDPTHSFTLHTLVTLHNVLASSLHAGSDYLWH